MPPSPPPPSDPEPPDGSDGTDATAGTGDTEGLFSTPWVATEPELGSMIGPYRLLDELGQGGMGKVYRARQEEPFRRLVALKLIRADRDTDGAIDRFNAERQALGGMQHTHIATIYDAGETPGGRPYVVMEFVEGERITDFADARRLPIDARLELFGQVCAAVTHAHQRGVLHLDLTAANVLTTEAGDRAAVKVIDFGIAAALGPEAGEAGPAAARDGHDGRVLGTRHAMSPEQAAGRDLDERADVYGLGVLLFGLLAGVWPESPNDPGAPNDTNAPGPGGSVPRCSQRLGGLTPDQRAKVAADRRLDPGTLVRKLHRELDFIPFKAMQPDREQRYASVEALRRDVDRYRRRLPIDAAPAVRGYRVRKFVARHRRALAGVVAALVVAAAGAGVVAHLADDNRKHSDRADVATRAAEREAGLKRRAAYRSNLFGAQKALERGEAASALRLLDACDPSLRHWEWGWLQAQADGATRILPHEGNVEDLTFSPDGSKFLTASTAGLARIWDAATGEERVTLYGHTRAVSAAAWSPDGLRVVTGSRDRTVRVWSTASSEATAVLRSLDQTVRAVGLTDGGARVVAAGTQRVCVWDATTGDLERQITTPRSIWRAVAPDGGSVLLAPKGGGLRRIGITEIERGWPTGGREIADAESVTVDGTEALMVHWADGAAELCDAATGATLRPLAGSSAPVTRTAWHAGRGIAATGHSDGSVWRHVGTGPGERVMAPNGIPVSALAWGATGRLAAGDGRGVIRVLDLAPTGDTSGPGDATPRTLTGHGAKITALTFDPAGRRLASAAADRTVRLWELGAARGEPAGGPPDRADLSYLAAAAALPVPPEVIGLPTARFFRRPGELHARADRHGGILLHGGSAPLVLLGHEKPAAGLLFSPDGRRLLSHGPDRTVRVWSTSTAGVSGPARVVRRADVVIRPPARRDIRTAVWSRDGRWIATGGGNGTTRLWEAATGRLLSTLSGTGPGVTALAFSGDTRWIAVGHADGTAAVWDPCPGDRLVVLTRHAAAVTGLAFSADAARVATTWADGELRIWDAADGEALLTLPLDDPSATPVFVRESTQTAPGRPDGTARVVLSGGPRPARPRGPQPEAEPDAASGTTRWVSAQSARPRGVDPTLIMRVTPGRRFNLLAPAGPDSPPMGAAAVDLLERLAVRADRIDRLLGLDSVPVPVSGPRPRLVAVPAAESHEAVVDLGRFGGLQSRRLLDSGWLSDLPSAPLTADPMPRLTQGLIRNAFDLAPQHGEFEGGVVRLISLLGARDDPGDPENPAARMRAELRVHLTTLEARYASDTLSFLDAFTRRGAVPASTHRYPDARPSSRRMFYAAAMLRLHATFSTKEDGDAWLGRVYRLLASAPPIPGETPAGALRQATLWCAAASAAAGRDLTPAFVDRWRLPMSDHVRARFADTDWSVRGPRFPRRLAPAGPVWIGLRRISVIHLKNQDMIHTFDLGKSHPRGAKRYPAQCRPDFASYSQVDSGFVHLSIAKTSFARTSVQRPARLHPHRTARRHRRHRVARRPAAPRPRQRPRHRPRRALHQQPPPDGRGRRRLRRRPPRPDPRHVDHHQPAQNPRAPRDTRWYLGLASYFGNNPARLTSVGSRRALVASPALFEIVRNLNCPEIDPDDAFFMRDWNQEGQGGTTMGINSIFNLNLPPQDVVAAGRHPEGRMVKLSDVPSPGACSTSPTATACCGLTATNTTTPSPPVGAGQTQTPYRVGLYGGDHRSPPTSVDHLFSPHPDDASRGVFLDGHVEPIEGGVERKTLDPWNG